MNCDKCLRQIQTQDQIAVVVKGKPTENCVAVMPLRGTTVTQVRMEGSKVTNAVYCMGCWNFAYQYL